MSSPIRNALPESTRKRPSSNLLPNNTGYVIASLSVRLSFKYRDFPSLKRIFVLIKYLLSTSPLELRTSLRFHSLASKPSRPNESNLTQCSQSLSNGFTFTACSDDVLAPVSTLASKPPSLSMGNLTHSFLPKISFLCLTRPIFISSQHFQSF